MSEERFCMSGAASEIFESYKFVKVIWAFIKPLLHAGPHTSAGTMAEQQSSHEAVEDIEPDSDSTDATESMSLSEGEEIMKCKWESEMFLHSSSHVISTELSIITFKFSS